jgi:hypothetical protein
MAAIAGIPARSRRVAPAAALAVAALIALPVRAADTALEYDVKAAFLLNFVRFVQWPAASFPEPGAPVCICVLRQNPFGDTLDRLVEGESVSGRPVSVRRIWTPDEAPACHVLFVPQSVLLEDGDAAVPADPGLLTVGESDAFLRRGGVIAFYTEAGRIRFAVNQDSAERSKLRFSARLLRVARLVRDGGGAN